MSEPEKYTAGEKLLYIGNNEVVQIIDVMPGNRYQVERPYSGRRTQVRGDTLDREYSRDLTGARPVPPMKPQTRIRPGEPADYLVTLRIVAPVTFRVTANSPGQAKRTALDIARQMAAEASATAKISDDVESAIDSKCDWSFGVPNRKEIPDPRRVRAKQ